MLQRFEHVGMISSNLDRTMAFYCGLMGYHLDLRDINEAVVAQAVVDVLTDAVVGAGVALWPTSLVLP